MSEHHLARLQELQIDPDKNVGMSNLNRLDAIADRRIFPGYVINDGDTLYLFGGGGRAVVRWLAERGETPLAICDGERWVAVSSDQWDAFFSDQFPVFQADELCELLKG